MKFKEWLENNKLIIGMVLGAIVILASIIGIIAISSDDENETSTTASSLQADATTTEDITTTDDTTESSEADTTTGVTTTTEAASTEETTSIVETTIAEETTEVETTTKEETTAKEETTTKKKEEETPTTSKRQEIEETTTKKKETEQQTTTKVVEENTTTKLIETTTNEITTTTREIETTTEEETTTEAPKRGENGVILEELQLYQKEGICDVPKTLEELRDFQGHIPNATCTVFMHYTVDRYFNSTSIFSNEINLYDATLNIGSTEEEVKAIYGEPMYEYSQENGTKVAIYKYLEIDRSEEQVIYLKFSFWNKLNHFLGSITIGNCTDLSLDELE